MKTWHHYWQNQYSKFLGVIFLLNLLPQLVLSQTTTLELPPNSTQYPGIFETFENLAQLDSVYLKNKISELQKNSGFPNNIDPKLVLIDADYIRSALLHTQESYLALIQNDTCRLYDLIASDLLKTADGSSQRILITYPDKEGNDQRAVINKKEFLEKVAFIQCPRIKEKIAKFQIKNLPKLSQELQFEEPSSMEQCEAVYLNWVKNPDAPYYCQIYSTLDEIPKSQQGLLSGDKKIKEFSEQRLSLAKIIKSRFSNSQLDYLQQFCQLLGQKDLFCKNFFKTSFWTKALDQDKYDSFLKPLCQSKSNKNWSLGLKKECIDQIKKQNNFCYYQGIQSSSLAPAMGCEQLSLALNHSGLRADYQDCPAQSDLQSITNFSRILIHQSPDGAKPFNGVCSSISSGEVFEFLKKNDLEENWGNKLCYFDTLDEKEKCYPVIFGNYGESSASLNKIVEKIMIKTKGFTERDKCRVVTNREYKPNLLEFKYGCFIVLEENECMISKCPLKVVWNERVMSQIKNQVSLPPEYFPTSGVAEKSSLAYLLQRQVGRTNNTLTSLTSINNFMRKSLKSIVHGVGCAEDLLPTFFKKQSFNQCTPLPFIIDGSIQEGEDATFVTRTAIDDLSTPRLISWSNIYSAVKSYQSYHPLRQWALYGSY